MNAAADPPKPAELELRAARPRRLAEADLPVFPAYRQDPGVARYQSWDETFLMDDAAALGHAFRTLGRRDGPMIGPTSPDRIENRARAGT